MSNESGKLGNGKNFITFGILHNYEEIAGCKSYFIMKNI